MTRASEDQASEEPRGNSSGRSLLPVLIGGGLVAAFAIVAAIESSDDDHIDVAMSPVTTADDVMTSPSVSIGSCVEHYDLNTLARREFAFDGKVTAIEGTSVTFTVSRWFTGGTGEEVTLDANGVTGEVMTSGGGPVLESGSRYLVAGDGGFVWGCGFTQPYSGDVAEDWATTFTKAK